MLIENQHPLNKHIMVSILGMPNVGKSSLVNELLGFDLSIVTHKPQTTRNSFRCVFTIDRTEVVLVDTPGIHKSGQEINKRLNEQSREGSSGVDFNLLLIDSTLDPIKQIKTFASVYENKLSRTVIVFTKIDLLKDADSFPVGSIKEFAKDYFDEIIATVKLSNTTGEGIHELNGLFCDLAKSSPHYYPDGSISNKSERFFVSEYIREQCFLTLKEELPYETAVIMEEYVDPPKFFSDDKSIKAPKKITHISASIIVNRPSQRGIVVGRGGAIIKEIGTNARKKIEALVGSQVNLNLHVKVSPKWFKNNHILEELGLPRAKDSARVWRPKVQSEDKVQL